jgi:hypothetical protein
MEQANLFLLLQLYVHIQPTILSNMILMSSRRTGVVELPIERSVFVNQNISIPS